MTSEREAMTLERQAFEHAFASGDVDYDAHIFRQFHDGSYYDEHAQDKWEGWQAAFKHLSRAAEPVAEIGPYWSLRYCGNDSIHAVAERHNLQVGTTLYTRPPEPARDAKDAARFHWLLENCSTNGGLGVEIFIGDEAPDAEDLIERIDAAMAQESGE